MKKPFAVGDRVRVYGHTQGVSFTDYDYAHTGYDGVVDRIVSPTEIRVNGRHKTYSAHPKQCRRLVKKKAREWWVRRDALVHVFHEVFTGVDEYVHVREVLK